MKKFVMLSLFGAVVLASGCSKKEPLTPAQQWNGYCTSIGNAARSIVLDRQNGITQAAAEEYANKVKDPTTRGFAHEQIKKAYALPETELMADRDAVQLRFKQEAEQICLNTPHDPNKLPDYKQF